MRKKFIICVTLCNKLNRRLKRFLEVSNSCLQTKRFGLGPCCVVKRLPVVIKEILTRHKMTRLFLSQNVAVITTLLKGGIPLQLYCNNLLLLVLLFGSKHLLEILLSTFSGCADILRDCASIVANDKDSCKSREMKENCPKSCNLCGKSGNAKTKWPLNDVIFL